MARSTESELFDWEPPAGSPADERERLRLAYPALAIFEKARPTDFEGLLEGARRGRAIWTACGHARALEIDREAGQNPRYVAQDVLRVAARERWFRMMMPHLFGGDGLSLMAFVVGLEELAAGCVGVANLLGVQALALSTLAMAGDVEKLLAIGKRITAAEAAGNPLLLSTALTEPAAGTDMEDPDLMRRGMIASQATPVPGGFRLTGRKVFISNGHIAAAHVTVMPLDRRDPVHTLSVFLVPADAPGVSIGRVEHKLGQRACAACEVVFEDCFVPDGARFGTRPMGFRLLELVLGATRGGVGALAAGLARGIYQRALARARRTSRRGEALLEQGTAAQTLAQMSSNAELARAAFVNAVLVNDRIGILYLLRPALIDRLAGHLPDAVRSRLDPSRLPKNVQSVSEKAILGIPDRAVSETTWHGAHAKSSGSDLALRNAELALELAGAEGLRAEHGIEKDLRDAKLLQIYEGTNELNRREMTRALLGGARETP